MKWPIKFRSVEVLQPKPGDVLVVEVDREVSQAEAETIINAMGQHFPANKCVIFSEGMRIKLVRPHELPDEADVAHVAL